MKKCFLGWGVLVVLFVSLAGCKNNNLFGGLHKDGSGDSDSLVSDGNSALASGDYAKADQYYSDALDKDPHNSEALYGQAAAAMGLSGLDIGQLVSNLTTGSGGAGGSSLSAELGKSVVKAPIMVTSTDPSSLLYRIDIPALDDALDTVIVNLETIRLGLGDGKVAPDSPSLLINLGVARLLKAVTVPWLGGILDIRESSGKYSVELLHDPVLVGDCPTVYDSTYNVAWGYQYLNTAATKLSLVSGTTLSDIKDDLNELYDDYRVEVVGVCAEVPLTLPTTLPTSPTERV